MSSFHDRVRKGKTEASGDPSWYPILYAKYPEIANVLAGCPNPPAGVEKIEPMSIIISERHGMLQFCISRKGGSDMWFGLIHAPEDLLGAIEGELAIGELTYQAKNGKGAGYRG